MKQATGKARGGMTMIEMIVAFALAAIFFAALIGVVAPVYRTYQRTRAASDAQMLAGNIIDAIRTSADRADSLTVSEGEVQVGVIRYTVSADGRLLYTVAGTDEAERGVFDEKFYGGNTIAMQAEQLSTPNTIRVTITVTTRDGVRTSQSGVISTLRQYIQGSTSEQGEPPPEGGDVTNPLTPSEIPDAQPEIDAWWGQNKLDFGEGPLAELLERLLGWLWGGKIDNGEEMFEAYYAANRNKLPEVQLNRIVSASKLSELRANGSILQGVYNALADDPNKTFYLAVYFACKHDNSGGGQGQKPTPIVYVTDTPFSGFHNEAFTNWSKRGNMYLTLFNDKWYILKDANRAGNMARNFDEKNTEEAMLAVLNTYFVQL